MRVALVALLWLVCTVFRALRADVAWAQRPGSGRERLVLPARTAAEEQKALHVPPGFEIQLVAAEPDIHKPLNLAFDDRGRLWVTDTVEYPYPAPQGTRPRDSVKILSNFRPTAGPARSRPSPTA